MWKTLTERSQKMIAAVGFRKPTEIQSLTYKSIMRRKNVVGISATGSGKTHAFLIPIVEKGEKSIIISPTRELAMQTYEKTKEYVKGTDIKLRLLIGGVDKEKQIKRLETGYDIIIATPGRIVDIYKSGFNAIIEARTLVVDECDTIFSLGFLNEVDFILSNMRENTQVMLFSATLEKEIERFVDKYLEKPDMYVIDQTSYINKNVENIAYRTAGKNKMDVILELTKTFDPYILMVFANKKDDVKKIAAKFRENGMKTAEIHGDLMQRERKNNLKRVTAGDFKYVVASDIAARGLDIDGVSHVIHYDLPLHDLEFFVHRSGRTGRGKNTGKNYVLYNDKEDLIITKLEDKGIVFSFLEYKNNQWVDLKDRKRKTKQKPLSELDSKIKAVVKKTNKQKVKPGYKKKMRKTISDMKRKNKREIIKEDIKRQRKERYKKSQRLTNMDD